MKLTIERIDADASVDENAELGFGSLLVAEDETGGYEPVAVVSTSREARELAATDFRFRMADVETGESPLCPARYAIWAKRFAGYTVVSTIDPA